MSNTASIYSEVPDLDTMGGRLSRARDAAGMSAAQLARRLGVQTSTLQAWEADRSQPRANRLSMLSGVLGVSLSWLLYGVGSAPAEDSDAEIATGLVLQLDRLKRLNDETAELIGQIESDLQRLASSSETRIPKRKRPGRQVTSMPACASFRVVEGSGPTCLWERAARGRRRGNRPKSLRQKNRRRGRQLWKVGAACPAPKV